MRERFVRSTWSGTLYDPASNGHLSAIYFSAASRTTQARDTYFFFAIISRVSYTSTGKLIDARTHAALCSLVALAMVFFAVIIDKPASSSPRYTVSVKMQPRPSGIRVTRRLHAARRCGRIFPAHRWTAARGRGAVAAALRVEQSHRTDHGDFLGKLKRVLVQARAAEKVLNFVQRFNWG